MSTQRYVSGIKIIDVDQEIVFNYLSDFENLGKYINEGLLQKVSEMVPQLKINNFEVDRDSCRFGLTGFGNAEIRIINRDPFNTVKIKSSGGLPVGLTLWIQLLPHEIKNTKMRLTLDADLSLMLKAMIGNRLDEGVDRLAELLAQLPYK